LTSSPSSPFASRRVFAVVSINSPSSLLTLFAINSFHFQCVNSSLYLHCLMMMMTDPGVVIVVVVVVVAADADAAAAADDDDVNTERLCRRSR